MSVCRIDKYFSRMKRIAKGNEHTKEKATFRERSSILESLMGV